MIRFFPVTVSLFFVFLSVSAEEIPTRFGKLTINDENVLSYNNRAVSPEIRGNYSLGMVDAYQLSGADVVLLQDSGGTACPAQFYLVTTSVNGVQSTPAFGTCSDLIEIKRTGESIVITMPGFMGPFESPAAQMKAAKEKHVYIFKDAVVTEDGRVVK